MATLANLNPFSTFTELDGDALDGGYIYVGVANQNPKQFPITVYWDELGTVPATQPLRTNGGYVTRSGKPAQVYVGQSYSILVEDRKRRQVFYVASYLPPELRGGLLQIENYAAMRAYTGIANSFFVCGRDVNGDAGGGSFYYDPSDTTSADNSGTILVGVTGKRFKRHYAGLVDPFWFGDVGGGVSDDSLAFNLALSTGGAVYAKKPKATYLLQSPIDLTVPGSEIVGDGMYSSVFTKAFNGEAIKLTAAGSKISRIGIEGAGATRTGGGAKMIGYNAVVEDCRIVDTDDSPVLVDPSVGSNALSGTYSEVSRCFLLPRNTSTTYAVRCTGVDDANRPTARVFRNISGGGPLVDFSGMNRASLTESLGTLVKFSATSGKINIQGCRFTNAAANITILGSDHTIDNNNWGFGVGFNVTIDATCANVSWGQNNNIVQGSSTLVAPIIVAAVGGGMPNTLTTPLISYTSGFAWYGTTSDGVFGNSTVSAFYSMTARKCYASFSIVRGSTATNAVGTWSFKLPFKANVTATGHALVKTSGSPTYYSAVCEVQGGSDRLFIYLNGSTAAMTDASIAFVTGGLIEATINYLVAAS